ncbi:hypothetical protein JZ751_005066 [Albula glossodonta]|uniref:Uncharacterized protein n=1 Tax=Albula glossodonta TaxID=121402 RepID=A0A8T2P5D0_9TELE|nr:hypothetical protein JZ751_005066 [Albula glossodonta]
MKHGSWGACVSAPHFNTQAEHSPVLTYRTALRLSQPCRRWHVSVLSPTVCSSFIELPPTLGDPAHFVNTVASHMDAAQTPIDYRMRFHIDLRLRIRPAPLLKIPAEQEVGGDI